MKTCKKCSQQYVVRDELHLALCDYFHNLSQKSLDLRRDMWKRAFKAYEPLALLELIRLGEETISGAGDDRLKEISEELEAIGDLSDDLYQSSNILLKNYEK